VIRAVAIALVAALFVLSGCIHLGRQVRPGARAALVPPDPARCAKLQSRALWLSLSAIGAGGIGSASTAVSGDITDTVPHWTLVGIGAGMSIAGGITGYLATWFAAQFTRLGCQ
jgi:hypothetical protein